MKKRIFVGLLVIILASVSYYINSSDKLLTNTYTGFIERDITKAMTQIGGKVIEINVSEGDHVKKGDLIASIDQSDLLFQKDRILSEIAIKQSKLDSLIEGADANDYKRLTLQQESLKLKIELAKDNLALKKNQLEDANALLESNAIGSDQVDNLKVAVQQAETELNVLKKEYESVTVSYNDLLEGVDHHTLEIAKSDLRLSEIALENIEWKIEETKILAPSDGIIRQVYFNDNEVVPQGGVIADLLKDNSLYVQFYVDEANFSRVHLEGPVQLTLDGSNEIIMAQITEISDYAQFTPKNISTKADRQSLVFKVKAALDENVSLHSGMMVDVELQEGGME